MASGCKIMDLKGSKVYQISGCLKLVKMAVNSKYSNYKKSKRKRKPEQEILPLLVISNKQLVIAKGPFCVINWYFSLFWNYFLFHFSINCSESSKLTVKRSQTLFRYISESPIFAVL